MTGMTVEGQKMLGLQGFFAAIFTAVDGSYTASVSAKKTMKKPRSAADSALRPSPLSRATLNRGDRASAPLLIRYVLTAGTRLPRRMVGISNKVSQVSPR
jgi:hypothetical protein